MLTSVYIVALTFSYFYLSLNLSAYFFCVRNIPHKLFQIIYLIFIIFFGVSCASKHPPHPSPHPWSGFVQLHTATAGPLIEKRGVALSVKLHGMRCKLHQCGGPMQGR